MIFFSFLPGPASEFLCFLFSMPYRAMMIKYFGSLLVAFADLEAFFFGLPLRAKAPPPPFECSCLPVGCSLHLLWHTMARQRRPSPLTGFKVGRSVCLVRRLECSAAVVALIWIDIVIPHLLCVANERLSLKIKGYLTRPLRTILISATY